MAFTDAELKQASVHLEYEIWMLHDILNVHETWQVTSQPTINNVLVESFLIHARNIYDFLYRVSPYTTDLLAEQFFAIPSDWRVSRPHVGMFFGNKENGDKINRFLAHLSWDRVHKDIPTWELRQIARELANALQVFAQRVDCARASDTLKQTIAKLDRATEAELPILDATTFIVNNSVLLQSAADVPSIIGYGEPPSGAT